MTQANVSDQRILSQGVDSLASLLDGWVIEVRPQDATPPELAPTAFIDLWDPNGTKATLAVEVSEHPPSPSHLLHLYPKLEFTRQQRVDVVGVLVIAPWLSSQARKALAERKYNYLDLTGNVSMRLSQPTVVIETTGVDRNPHPKVRGERGLVGPRAGRLVRSMIDFAPPYRASTLEKYAGISLPYVSRLLDVMEKRALITRQGRVIVDVDWQGLLRARAEQYDLLRANSFVPMLAPQGINTALTRLSKDAELVDSTAVTGSVAAQSVAPIAVGGQLMIYVPPGPHQPDEIGKAMGLLRSEKADVLLLRAGNEVVFERTRLVNGIRHVALSQLALDCLGGSGRMPPEGEAIIEYMSANENLWRLRSPESHE